MRYSHPLWYNAIIGIGLSTLSLKAYTPLLSPLFSRCSSNKSKSAEGDMEDVGIAELGAQRAARKPKLQAVLRHVKAGFSVKQQNEAYLYYNVSSELQLLGIFYERNGRLDLGCLESQRASKCCPLFPMLFHAAAAPDSQIESEQFLRGSLAVAPAMFVLSRGGFWTPCCAFEFLDATKIVASSFAISLMAAPISSTLRHKSLSPLPTPSLRPKKPLGMVAAQPKLKYTHIKSRASTSLLSASILPPKKLPGGFAGVNVVWERLVQTCSQFLKTLCCSLQSGALPPHGFLLSSCCPHNILYPVSIMMCSCEPVTMKSALLPIVFKLHGWGVLGLRYSWIQYTPMSRGKMGLVRSPPLYTIFQLHNWGPVFKLELVFTAHWGPCSMLPSLHPSRHVFSNCRSDINGSLYFANMHFVAKSSPSPTLPNLCHQWVINLGSGWAYEAGGDRALSPTLMPPSRGDAKMKISSPFTSNSCSSFAISPLGFATRPELPNTLLCSWCYLTGSDKDQDFMANRLSVLSVDKHTQQDSELFPAVLLHGCCEFRNCNNQNVVLVYRATSTSILTTCQQVYHGAKYIIGKVIYLVCEGPMKILASLDGSINSIMPIFSHGSDRYVLLPVLLALLIVNPDDLIVSSRQKKIGCQVPKNKLFSMLLAKEPFAIGAIGATTGEIGKVTVMTATVVDVTFFGSVRMALQTQPRRPADSLPRGDSKCRWIGSLSQGDLFPSIPTKIFDLFFTSPETISTHAIKKEPMSRGAKARRVVSWTTLDSARALYGSIRHFMDYDLERLLQWQSTTRHEREPTRSCTGTSPAVTLLTSPFDITEQLDMGCLSFNKSQYAGSNLPTPKYLHFSGFPRRPFPAYFALAIHLHEAESQYQVCRNEKPTAFEGASTIAKNIGGFSSFASTASNNSPVIGPQKLLASSPKQKTSILRTISVVPPPIDRSQTSLFPFSNTIRFRTLTTTANLRPHVFFSRYQGLQLNRKNTTQLSDRSFLLTGYVERGYSLVIAAGVARNLGFSLLCPPFTNHLTLSSAAKWRHRSATHGATATQ
ncbi:uncharacterized protein BDR25DRAFT_361587 [Lindgomyces ingoldianus]|uniref:Uncharacterized protein n=1 Tax=Lindgomyces ingoldianus TaxID=673940 RepID=A0ACB6QC04_9PLEO|nr:uncharacterized protein BDR25DRAFT_361587 [Lindgomyces ingoldianus]KAF2464509.1 hypothetical protein BDR25DRAFT_361587 [Lindgomyces ingoldianus]